MNGFVSLVRVRYEKRSPSQEDDDDCWFLFRRFWHVDKVCTVVLLKKSTRQTMALNTVPMRI